MCKVQSSDSAFPNRHTCSRSTFNAHQRSSSLQVSFSQRQRMGQVKSRSPTASENDTILHKIPDLKFRVLVVGRANAGKTTILHRISRDSEVFKLDSRGVLEPVRPHLQSQCHLQTHYLASMQFTPQWRLGRFILIGDC